MQYQSYIICTSPRSGSTLLCQLLTSSGVAGVPKTPFHNASVAGAEGNAGRERVAEALSKAIDQGRGRSDIFGMRLQMHSFRYFLDDLALLHPDLPGDRARLDKVFGPTLCLHLTRRDKLAQAVSYVRASQTGLWHQAPDGSEIERLSEPAEPVFDPAAIRDQIDTFEAYDKAWHDWFHREGIDPFRVNYEDLARDPIATLRRILDALSLDKARADAVEIGVAKLADATSEAWKTRFRALESDGNSRNPLKQPQPGVRRSL